MLVEAKERRDVCRPGLSREQGREGQAGVDLTLPGRQGRLGPRRGSRRATTARARTAPRGRRRSATHRAVCSSGWKRLRSSVNATGAETIAASSPRATRSSRSGSSRRGGAESMTTPPPTVDSCRRIDAVAGRDDERPLETKLGVTRTGAQQPRRHGGGAVADRDRGRRAELIGLLENDVDAVGRRDGSGRHERVAGRRPAAALRHDRERDAASRLGALGRLAVNLDASHADLEPGREHLEPVARRDRARPESAGHDRAGPREAEGAIAYRRAAPVRRRECAVRRPVRALRGARRAQGPEPRSRERCRWSGRSSATASQVARTRSASTASIFVTATTPRSTPRSRRIRRCSSVCGFGPLARVDGEQEEVDAGRAGHHRPDEALMARDVDHGEERAVGKLELGVSEHDRDPALLLLRAGGPCRLRSGPRRASSCRGRCGPRCRG